MSLRNECVYIDVSKKLNSNNQVWNNHAWTEHEWINIFSAETPSKYGSGIMVYERAAAGLREFGLKRCTHFAAKKS